VRDTGRKPGELLDGPLHGEADGPHCFVDRADGVDGTVGRLVELVQLRIHPIHRASDLVDDRQNLLLRPSDQRGKAVERYGQAQEGPPEPESDRNEEDGESEIGDVSGSESDEHGCKA